MIDINLFELLAANEPAIEDEAEKIAFDKIPGPPLPGLRIKPEIGSDKKDDGLGRLGDIETNHRSQRWTKKSP